jgi:hypothetical protein
MKTKPGYMSLFLPDRACISNQTACFIVLVFKIEVGGLNQVPLKEITEYVNAYRKFPQRK